MLAVGMLGAKVCARLQKHLALGFLMQSFFLFFTFIHGAFLSTCPLAFSFDSFVGHTVICCVQVLLGSWQGVDTKWEDEGRVWWALWREDE